MDERCPAQDGLNQCVLHDGHLGYHSAEAPEPPADPAADPVDLSKPEPTNDPAPAGETNQE